MFMSTRYKKRSEQNAKIFSADDSLPKLCEVLNNESRYSMFIIKGTIYK